MKTIKIQKKSEFCSLPRKNSEFFQKIPENGKNSEFFQKIQSFVSCGHPVPLHWHSKTPVRYKRNAITGDLHRAKKISCAYQDEVKTIHDKFVTAGFPERFVTSVINNFSNPASRDESFLIRFA